MLITIRNNYHGTVARVQVEDGGMLSKSQVDRVRRRLCGRAACKCGGNLSERGPQPGIEIVANQDGRVLIWFTSNSGGK